MNWRAQLITHLFQVSLKFPEQVHCRHVLRQRTQLRLLTRSGELNPKSHNLSGMTKETEYRANAANSIELANRASSMGDRSRLLELAEKWLDLADRTHRLTQRFEPLRWQHPLLRSKLGDEIHPDAE
jgi:DnaJ-domain-containing protein 1